MIAHPKGGMFRIRRKHKHCQCVVFGHVWNGHITVTSEEYANFDLSGRKWSGVGRFYDNIGNVKSLDTRDVVMVVDFYERGDNLWFKVWAGDNFLFFRINQIDHELMEVIEMTEDLRLPNFGK